MRTLDPTLVALLVSLMTVAVGMVLLGQSQSLLEERRRERCAACGRDLARGRRCSCLELDS